MDVEVVPIGLDVGSLHARIAVSDPIKIDYTVTNFPSCQTPSSFPPLPTVIANSSGSRHTIALLVSEHEINIFGDQVIVDQATISKKMIKNKEYSTAKYVFGDAARRELLNKDITTLSERSIRYLLSLTDNLQHSNTVNMITEYGISPTKFKVETFDENKKSTACFFQHLIQQACNYTSSHPSLLRIVISVPDNATHYLVHNTLQATLNGLDHAIKASGGYLNLNKEKNKSKLRTRYKPNYCVKELVNVIGESSAICMAHGLFVETNFYSTTIDCRNILVLNWGASSLSITHLLKLGSSNMLSIRCTKSYESLSGTLIKSLLMSHIAEVFEIKNRLSSGSVRKNTKAWNRLEIASFDAIKALGRCPNVTVAVDGLYYGIDLNIQVSRVRFERLCGNLLKQAELLIRSMITNLCNNVNGHYGGYDVVLVGGNVMDMPAVKSLIDSIFPSSNTCWRGRSENIIPPNQAVSLGCSMYASMLFSPFSMGLRLHGYTDDTSIEGNNWIGKFDNNKCKYHIETNVALCPTTIAIGIITSEMVDTKVHNYINDKASNILIHDILIDKHTPLPVQITKIFYPPPDYEHSQDTICIIQFFSNSNIEERYNVLANIESVEKNNNIEIIIELTLEGELSLSLDGCPFVSLS